MALIEIALLAVLYFTYRTISSYLAAKRFQAFANSNGCKPALQRPDSFPYGFRRLRRMMRMKKNGEDMFDDILMSDFTNAWTVQIRSFDGSSMLQTAEPANLQAMLATKFDDFITSERRYHVLKPVIGRSIFSSDGAFWAHSRAMFRPQFNRDNINDLESTNLASSKLFEAIGPLNEEGWTTGTDLLPLFYNFTLDTATDFLFGQSVDSQQIAIDAMKGSASADSGALEARAAGVEVFTKAFGVMNEGLILRIRLASFYWIADGPKFRKAINVIRSFTAPIVQRAVETARSPSAKEVEKQSLLMRLAEQTQDRTELRNQTLAILVAGRDTTSALLGWAMSRLAVHKEVFSELRKVVLREMEPGSDITFAKLKGCRPLQHFLNEVLRLHPTVPFNFRMAAKDTSIPVGGGPDQQSPIAVRKGQIVLFSVYILHRRKDLWGDDALEFKPERWEKRYPAWQFLPFLGGPRICLGQQYALVEASYLLVRLLQRYDAIEPADLDAAKFPKGIALTMWPGNGVKVRLHAASPLPT